MNFCASSCVFPAAHDARSACVMNSPWGEDGKPLYFEERAAKSGVAATMESRAMLMRIRRDMGGPPELLRIRWRSESVESISEFRRNQPEILVPPFVDHRNAVGIEIAEDDELVFRVVEAEGGLFD